MNRLRKIFQAYRLLSLTEFRIFMIAVLLHHGQKRKYSGVPYWTHLLAVALKVKATGVPSEVVAAALLHDSLEDPLLEFSNRCGFLLQRIRSVRGLDHVLVLDLVLDLTDVYIKRDYPDLNRLERKALEVERLEAISHYAKIIKLADIADNGGDIKYQDPDFFVVFRRECLDALRVLRHADERIAKEGYLILGLGSELS